MSCTSCSTTWGTRRWGLAHVHGPALEMAERSGLLANVGADRVFPATPAAVAWARSVADAPTPGLGRRAGPG